MAATDLRETLKYRDGLTWTGKVNYFCQIKKLDPKYSILQQTINRNSNVFTRYCCELKVNEERFYSSIDVTLEQNSDKKIRESLIKYSKEVAAKNYICEEFSDAARIEYYSCSIEKIVNYVTKKKSSNCTKQKRTERGRLRLEQIEKTNLFLDIERSQGSEISEMIQLSCCYGKTFRTENSFNTFIMPQGVIDRCGSLMSHKITKQGNNLMQRNILVNSVSLSEALMSFINYLKDLNRNDQTNNKVTIITHGEQDIVTLLNALAKIRKEKEFLAEICGLIDFNQAIKADESIMNLTHGISSLTKTNFRDPRQKNLVQVLLNSDVDTEQSHDALYDVSVLMKVYWKYLESHFVGTVSQFRSSWLETHFETRVKRQVEKNVS